MQSLPHYVFALNGRIGRVHYWILVVAGLAIVLVAATVGSLNLNNDRFNGSRMPSCFEFSSDPLGDYSTLA